MFDVLEADIVVLQETKIQRKDLRDDMVLVPGWDCFFSFPKYKKDGITGINPSTTKDTAFRDLPSHEQIGGYPSEEQLNLSLVDAETLDSEGRCVILEFQAFVLIGVYLPAVRNELRDDFRLGFLRVFECRVRNLIALGKRIIVAGDLNISRDVQDSASALADVLGERLSREQYISTPSRALFNELVTDSSDYDSSEPNNNAQCVLWDICRDFHPSRKGMFTCWDMKTNARPGNFGSRIDYILCSLNIRDWFVAADAQQHLMGSDHCPVFAVLKENILLDAKETRLRDVMGVKNHSLDEGDPQKSVKSQLHPLSGRRYPEFRGRRDIKQMLFQRPASSGVSTNPKRMLSNAVRPEEHSSPPSHAKLKRDRSPGVTESRPLKKTYARSPSALYHSRKRTATAQPTLNNFFKPYNSEITTGVENQLNSVQEIETSQVACQLTSGEKYDRYSKDDDTIKAWANIFTPQQAPSCEGHGEPCISLVTKKAGLNQGRSFWMCPRPLGPSGSAEKGTQWRCATFIWCSDWETRQSRHSKGS
uniref:DNA-(apurinic or apyrimidinic site) endonuclease 2 n=1 Tax=Ascosphaera apis TaxID=5105 RepID=A3EZ52_9EURO|nr:DNA lyase [Ascosphaera apis]